MHVPIMYRSIEINALVDTACSSSVMQRAYVNDHITPTPDKVIKGLADNRVCSDGVARIEFSMGDLKFSSDFIIVPDDVIRSPIILGNNFFLENNIEVDVHNKHLAGKGSTGSWDMYFHDSPLVYHRLVEVHALKDVKITSGDTVLM